MSVLVRTDADPNNKPSVTIFKKLAQFLDCVNIPYVSSENNSYTFMLQTPTETPTEDVSQAGSMSATLGGYTYVITEYNANTGEGIDEGEDNEGMFSGMESRISPASDATGNFTSKKAVITVGATAKNSDATHKKIWGTKDGGTIYYYLGYVAVGTTDFDDDDITRDANLVLGELTTLSDGSTTQVDLNFPVRNHAYSVATDKRIITCGVKPYDTGTVAVTNDNLTVTGTGTTWTRAMEGCFFQVAGDTRKYKIKTVGSTTSITLEDGDEYQGSTDSGLSYEVAADDSVANWSALHPLTAYPMWWAFPLSHARDLANKDNTKVMGCNKMGNKPVIFKQKSYIILSENGDEFTPRNSQTAVGICSHHAVVETDSGSLIFPTFDGAIYEASGVIAVDLNINLSKTVDGINKARLPYLAAAWYGDDNNWYMMCYTKRGGTKHDRILVYSKKIRQWVIWEVEANCIGIIKSTESGQVVFKPWIGSQGAFIYKMLTGNNLGAGSTGTTSGTVASSGNSTLVYTAGGFYTTDDGLKDVDVSIYNSSDVFQEKQKILSNTGDTITIDGTWDSNPVSTDKFYVGDIPYHWESGVRDYGTDNQKTANDVLLGYRKMDSSINARVKFYFSQDAYMVGDTPFDTITFDLSKDYREPPTVKQNSFRAMKYRIDGHGVGDPQTIYNIRMDIEGWLA